MARSLSSMKRMRQTVKRAAANKARRSHVKSKVKSFDDALKSKDTKKIDEAFREAVKELDRSGTRRTLHPNAVARRKSRMARRVNQLKAAGAS